MHFATYTPNFGPYADPRTVAVLAQEAEESGWDGFFVWDHMLWTDPEPLPVGDPYTILAAVALSTSRVKLGPLVTPLPRRRPWYVARQAISLDHLSQGRLVLGVGIGGDWYHDYSGFGEPPDDKIRGAKLDEALDVMTGLWSGEPFSYEGEHYRVDNVTMLPRPLQQPRIPIWVAGTWPRHKKPLRRAARFDGSFPLGWNQDLSPDDFRTMLSYIMEHRTGDGPFDLVFVNAPQDVDPTPTPERVAAYAEAGVTWWLEPTRPGQPYEEMRKRIRNGPPRLG